MNINLLENGFFSVNTSLLIDGNSCLLIDPGSGSLSLLDKISAMHLNCCGILITHPHIDHVDGIPILKLKIPDIKVFIAEDAVPHLADIPYQARLFRLPVPAPIQYDTLLKDEGLIQIGPFSVQYFLTPGHCPGSLSFLIERSIFTGDVLFYESIGRTDLEGGDFTLLNNSIKEKLFTLPDDTTVYPGHGESTTIGWEKKNNPYVKK